MLRRVGGDGAELRIGGVRLGGRPVVAVPFTDRATRAEVGAAAARGMDVAELRVDLFATSEPSRVLAVAPIFAGTATLATIRCAAEGGGWKGSESERAALYRALLPHADAIDVEIASAIARDLVAEARSREVLAIASFHDFAATPDAATLDGVVARGRALGADVVKIATHVADRRDLRTLARVLVAHDEVGLIVIGMGERAAASRVLFSALGSILTYATTETQTAPGQLPLDELVAALRRFAV